MIEQAKQDWSSGRAFWRQTNSRTKAGTFRLWRDWENGRKIPNLTGKDRSIKAPWSDWIKANIGGPEQLHQACQKAA